MALFSTQGLIDHLVKLVVSEDNAFLLLDKPAFQQLIQYLCPSLPQQDIPHRTKIREEVLAHTVQAESRVKVALQVCSVFVRHAKCLLCYKAVKGEISFTFNLWTSEGTGSNPYLLITAHYVNSPIDKPDQWVLKNNQLAFTLLEGYHTGANIASIITSVLKQYEICGKVCVIFMLCTDANYLYSGWFTTNNASNNDTALKELKGLIDPDGDRWDPVQR